MIKQFYIYKNNAIKLAFAVLLFAFAGMQSMKAQTTIRYQKSIQGGVTMAGNSFQYSLPSNPGLNLTPDVDGDPSTARSTSADLILPTGSTIVKVFLSVETNAAQFTSIKLKVPGAASYTTLLGTAALSVKTLTPFSGQPAQTYNQAVFDITSMVPTTAYASVAAGGVAGRFFVADETPISNNGYGGGWSISVVYTNPNSKFRNITLADDFKVIQPSTGTNTVTVTGVKVKPTGGTKAVVGITSTSGDRGLRDIATFGKVGGTQTNLADPQTAATDDIANSSIAFAANNNVSADGGPAISGNITTRNPISAGHAFGASESYDYDSDILNADNLFPNSTTPIDVVFAQQSLTGTVTDLFAAGSYFISVDEATPPTLLKTLSPTSIADGGTATYTFTVTNPTTDGVAQTITFTDNLPANIKLAALPNASIVGGTGGTTTAVAGASTFTVTGLVLQPGQSATIKVDITNVAGQYNASCTGNPGPFTNSAANITTPSNVSLITSGIVPQCLIVTAPVPCSITLATAGTNTQTVSAGTAITPIVYNLVSATGATISPALPAGLNGTYDAGANTYTISGTPTASSVYNYTVTATGTGCTGITATGTITVNALATNICPATTVDLATHTTGVAPTGSTLKWFKAPDLTTPIANPGTVGAGTYYAAYVANDNSCRSPFSAGVVVTITVCACYNDPNLNGGTAVPSNQGITLLKRAGADNGNWPMVRSSAFTVLESNTKGFVVTRLSTLEIEGQTLPTVIAAKIVAPQDGMMVYDTTAKCLKIYTVDETTPANSAWNCYTVPACP